MFSSKLLIRSFVLLIVAMIVIDAWPVQSWNLIIKRPTVKLMDMIGLRQGSWAMFTPNPVLNNRWISAEMKTKDGRTINWDSPLWSRATIWEKFVGFRHVNYFNRIFQSWCTTGGEDFLQHLARNSHEDLQSVQMHLNRMDLVMPEDGSMPPREETEWRLILEPWLAREGDGLLSNPSLNASKSHSGSSQD